MEDNDTDLGGEDMSVEQATAAYLKSTADGADKGQPEPDELEDEGTPAEDTDESDQEEDESEGEPDDEQGQPDEEDEDEPETEQGRFVAANGRVKLPDGTVATVQDLIQGNLKDRDYRQKTMSLAEEKRAIESQSSQVKASLQEIEQQREYVTTLLRSITPQPPPTTLLDHNSPDYDPIAYMEQEAVYKNFLAHDQYLAQQSDAVKKQAEEAQEAELASRQSQEWEKLLAAAPELKDQAKLAKFSQTMISTAQHYGYSPQEVTSSLPNDHRLALVLKDAAAWRRLQQNKPKTTEKIEGRPPIQRSGKRSSQGAQKARRATDAISRLKETGTVEDATAAFLASMKG